jgi:hypothetical protein
MGDKGKMTKIAKCLGCGRTIKCTLYRGTQGYCFWKCRECARKHLGDNVKRWQ